MRNCLKPDKQNLVRGKRRKPGASKRDFVDVTKAEMLRCPLPSCGYRPINTKNLRRSICSHCGTVHGVAFTYTYHFRILRG